LWLTGDGQLAELSVSLQALPDSSPDNLAAMIRNHADPLAHVSAEVARSMRQAVAGISLERLLTQELHELVATVRADVLNRLRTQPGLRLADLVIAVDRVGPPWPVTDAFREAARASHQAERIAIDASTQATSAGIEAESEARKLVEDATAGAADRLTTAKAQADAFRTFVSARKSHTNLTDHRLFWSQLSEILKDRPKMLLDVPRGDLYGIDAPKRHLVLPEAPILFAEPVVPPSADPEKPAPEAPGARP
jgi:regulator of protease activity HflC (stomatin/prohibitin superfamily)